jgi:hypothetical protein
MADVEILLGYKNTAWFTANAAIILEPGQIVFLEQTGTYKLGDGVTALSALSFLGGNSGGVQSVTGDGVDNTDPLNPTLTFPTPSEIGALTSANITQVITNGVTDKAPSEDAVFDALALKQNIVSGVDDTEIGYLNGVTSSIQTQLNNKGYQMSFKPNALIASPARSTTYVLPVVSIGLLGVATNSRGRHLAMANGTTVTVNFTHNNGVGTNEGVIIELVNVTTSTTLTLSTTVDMSITSANLNYVNKSFIYSVGDIIEARFTTPNWVTIPVNLITAMNVLFK